MRIFCGKLSVRIARQQLAAGAAVALVVCVALVSQSRTSLQSQVPTLTSLTRVMRWADAPETTMLAAEDAVFTGLVGNPDGSMECDKPETCVLAVLRSSIPCSSF